MKRASLLLALSVLTGSVFIQDIAPVQAAGQQQVYSALTPEQASAMLDELGFLVEGASLSGIESVTDPQPSWKLSFASPQATPDKYYSGYVQLSKNDGTLIAVKLNQKSGSRIPEQIFDINEQKVNREEARIVVESYMTAMPWFDELSLMYRPHPLTYYETRYEDNSLHFILYDSSLNNIRHIPGGRRVFKADVDRRTGELAGYSVDWVRPQDQAAVEVVPIGEIANQLFNSVQPELAYTYPHQEAAHSPLVWSLNIRGRQFDAVTGEWEGVPPIDVLQSYRPIGTPPDKPFLTKRDITEEEYQNAPWPSFDEETARQNALYYLQEKAPPFLEQLVEVSSGLSFWSGPKVYSFYFVRMPGGAMLSASETVELSVDAVTGELRFFNSSLTGKEYPATAAPIIQQEQAKRMLLSLYDIELQYNDWGNGNLKLVYEIKTKPEVPVFTNGTTPYLDATKPNQWFNFLSYPIKEPMPAASEWLNDIISAPKNIAYPAAIALNGKFVPLDPEPVMVGHSTMVPIRALVDALGGTVHWDNSTRTVTAALGGKQVDLVINNPPDTVVEGEYGSWRVIPAALMINDSVYVSVRLVSEMLGASVHWYGPSRIVDIQTEIPSSEELTEEELAELELTEEELKQIRLQAQLNWEEKHGYLVVK